MNKTTASTSETANVYRKPPIIWEWWAFILILFGATLSAAPIEVSDLAGLQTIIDNGFVDDGMIRMHPPGATYNETLPMVSMGAAFQASFLQNAGATTQYGIPRYTIEVSEAEPPPYTRTWTSTNGQVLHTSTPPAGYDPQNWVLTNFPPPDYLDPSELTDYVHDRRPGRRTLHITLIHATDLPAWNQALADESSAQALDDPDPQELYVGMVRPLADGSGIELYTQVPWSIGVVGLYSKNSLLDPDWQQSGSFTVDTQPFWVQAIPDGDIGFFFVANHVLDTDSDGVIDALEIFVNGTNPNNSDSDGDGLSDGEELWTFGTNPLNADSDGDGLSDGFEAENGGDPNDGTDGGQQFLIVTGYGDAGVEITGEETYTLQPNGGSYLVFAYVHSEEYPVYTGSQSEFDDRLRWDIQPSNGDPITGNVSVNTLHDDWEDSESEGTSFLGYAPIAMMGFGVVYSEPEEVVTIDVEVGVSNIADGALPSTAIIAFLPLETVPEVVRVNSDYDEGRINPTTGYAIPDCDDVPDVDPETGSGNDTPILTAVRDHLDGTYSNTQIITDDLHQAWFGLLPSTFEDEWWDDATVTIRKLDITDPITGIKETGQVRFYATWGSESLPYFGVINPYDLDTLEPVNLVSDTEPLLPNLAVYGSGSIIPEDATFWIEGVRPGKITLEWRLQKGALDVTHTQTFTVCTQQSKEAWFEELAYMIRLQTQDDPSGNVTFWVEWPAFQTETYGGEIDVRNSPTLAAGYAKNMERASEYYDYYAQAWNTKPELSWAGLARVVGGQVVAGISDAQWGIASLPDFVDVGFWFGDADGNDLKAFQLELFKGGESIFKDIGWQHYAYSASGICALQYVFDEQGALPIIPELVLDGWKLIDEGARENDPAKILLGSINIADYEQNEVDEEIYPRLDAIGDGFLANAMSVLAENPVQGGDHFRDVVGLGSLLSDTEKRWQWVTAGLPGYTHPGKMGILKTWSDATDAAQTTAVNENLRINARRFSAPWIFSTITTPAAPDMDIFVWDHLDQPGEQ